MGGGRERGRERERKRERERERDMNSQTILGKGSSTVSWKRVVKHIQHLPQI